MSPMTEHPSSELLALRAGGDLAALEARSIDEHLASCALCNAEIRELVVSMETFRALAPEPAASDVRMLRQTVLQRTSPPLIRWGRIAAAAAAIVIVAGAGALWFGHRAVSTVAAVAHVTPAQTQNDSSKAPVLAVKRQTIYKGPPSSGRPRLIQPVRMAATWAPPQGQHRLTTPSLKEISRQTETGEPAELRLVSSNPRVVVLWQMSDTNASPDETGTEGNNRQ
jgi:hypothetical protein